MSDEKIDLSERKVKLLERILKWFTGATEIRYHCNKPFSNKWGWIELVDVDPDDVHTHGWDDGLPLDCNSEIYEDELLEEMFKEKPTRIIAEIWYDVNPDDRIKELEKMLEEMQKKYHIKVDIKSNT